MKYILAVTGASGSIYAIRLAEELVKKGIELHLIFSANGEDVMLHETKETRFSLVERLKKTREEHKKSAEIYLHENNNLFAPPASGSFAHDGMIIVPCSMASLAAIARGTLSSLLGRAADVSLKESRLLLAVPREMPYSRVHLKAMLELQEAGGKIIPASPAFYNHPKTLDDLVNSVVARILDSLGIGHQLFPPWGNSQCSV